MKTEGNVIELQDRNGNIIEINNYYYYSIVSNSSWEKNEKKAGPQDKKISK
jgi:hypothetical protein